MDNFQKPLHFHLQTKAHFKNSFRFRPLNVSFSYCSFVLNVARDNDNIFSRNSKYACPNFANYLRIGWTFIRHCVQKLDMLQ